MEQPRTAHVLNLLKRLSGLGSDQAIADRTGGEMSRRKVTRLRLGQQTMTIEDGATLALALDVDPAVWFMDPAEAANHAIAGWGSVVGGPGQNWKILNSQTPPAVTGWALAAC